ncbi:hypothetical protein [Parafrankia sp. CH37]|uniref:hypothetical protein n=1 Tax=Parafrankia sp. CH37 TaxID=683308 RepID=UPI0010424CBD|nr:hypothetical protein [Parafrankia sp. CH37]
MKRISDICAEWLIESLPVIAQSHMKMWSELLDFYTEADARSNNDDLRLESDFGDAREPLCIELRMLPFGSTVTAGRSRLLLRPTPW